MGGRAGVGVAYEVSPRISLRVDGDVDILTASETAAAPDMRLWNYRGGVALELLPERQTRWNIVADVGAGATTFSSDEFVEVDGVAPESEADFVQTTSRPTAEFGWATTSPRT